jgi:hypothetical protein
MMRRAPGRRVRRVLDRVDWADDAGFTGGAEVLPFGFLIFVIGMLLVTNLWAVIDTKMAMDAATREGARLVAESDGPGPDPQHLGRQAAEASLQAHNREAGPLEYRVEYPGGTWQPCGVATVTASYRVPLISLPLIGASYGDGQLVSSTHSEIIDPYRSRTDNYGETRCANRR